MRHVDHKCCKLLILLTLLIVLMPAAPYAATKVLDYGFEDWSGNADTTPGYPFSTSHWTTHLNATNVVNGSCGGVAPHSGSHYFHQQHWSGIGRGDDPCLGSNDDVESVNPHTLISLGSMNEIFVHFYFQTNAEYGRTAGGNRLKWIELIGNTAIDGWAHMSSDGGIHMYEETAASWGSKVSWPGGNPHGDGQWHSFAMYVNIRSGQQSLWLDTTDWSNPTATRQYSFGSTTQFGHLVMSENFSADQPSGSAWVKFDDIEIWDGMPDSDQGSTEPTVPTDNSPSIIIASPTQNSTFEASEDTIILAGNASDDYGLSSITWSTSTGYQGSVSGGLNNWSTGSIPIQEGENRITVTARDNNNQTASDVLTVTYMPGDNNLTWRATEQTGDSSWSDSTAAGCVRVLIEGSSITNEGGQAILGFQGRNNGSYAIRKVSIAQTDPNGTEGDVINSTWTRVTFDGNDDANWETDSTTVSAGTEKLSDPISFNIEANKDYYVTFVIEAPATYLNAPSFYSLLYFLDTDHASDLDWSSNGCSSFDARLEALSSIYILDGDGDGPVLAIPGIPGNPQILVD